DERKIECQVLAMRLRAGNTIYEKAIEEFQRRGLPLNPSHRSVFVFINLTSQEFAILVDEGLAPALTYDDLNAWAGFLSKSFSGERYSQGLEDLFGRFASLET